MEIIIIYLIGVILSFIMSYIWFILWINCTYNTYEDRTEVYYEDFLESDTKPFLGICTLLSFIGCFIMSFLLIHITLKYLGIIPIFNNFMNKITNLYYKFIEGIFKINTK